MRTRIAKWSLWIVILLVIGILAPYLITYIPPTISCFLVFPIYINGEASTERIEIDANDSLFLKNAFNFKRVYFDKPSCGFTNEYAFEFYHNRKLSNAFFIAMDECPTYQVSEIRCVFINDNDHETVQMIIDKYRQRLNGELRRI
ncbi:MAG: hypothetical protein RR296_03820 [Clostridia bacterium]